MLKKIRSSWTLIKDSISVFDKHPKFLVPLLITWAIYAPVILYYVYDYGLNKHSFLQNVLVAFVIIFIFASILTLSCSLLLELIQQLESGRKTDLRGAFKVTFKQNIVDIIPLVFVWAVIWWLISAVQAFFTRKNQYEGDKTLTAENAAKTLAGYDENFNLSKAFFEALRKGVRMIMFLILPAIAWENKKFGDAVSKGMAVFKTNIVHFVSGFVLLEGIDILIFFPAGILFGLADGMEIFSSDTVWVIAIFYIAFAWSYSIYLEQMFAAELYLWNLKWEKQVAKAKNEGLPVPNLSEIPKPSLLDEIHEF